MATQESSVLFSLHELREMEHDRIREEAEHERRRQEAEIRAREAEERRVREAEETRLRAIEEARREAHLERERLAAEERVRMHEAEVRARTEEQNRLEAARFEAETRTAMALQQTFPYGKVIGGALLSVGAVVVALVLIMQRNDAETVKRAAAAAARVDADQREMAAQHAQEQKRLEQQLADLKDRMKASRDLANEGSQRRQVEEKHRVARPRGPKAPPPTATKNPAIKLDPASLIDPTGGLKLD
jgi:colicin import membrane protein